MTTANLRARVALAELEALGLTIEDLLAVAGQTARPVPPALPSRSASPGWFVATTTRPIRVRRGPGA